jgi:hypothetical protein
VAVFATLSASLRGKLMILREAALLVGALEPPFEAISRCSLSSMPAKPRPCFAIALLQVLRGNAPVDEPVLPDVVFSGRKAGRASCAAWVVPRPDRGFATFADNPICAVVPAESSWRGLRRLLRVYVTAPNRAGVLPDCFVF